MSVIKAFIRAQPFFNIRQSTSVKNHISVMWLRKVLSSALPMYQNPQGCLDQTRSYYTIKKICIYNVRESFKMENSKQISDFLQSSDFIGDQKICSCRNLRNGLTRELSLQNHINHSSEKPYKCLEFLENFSPSSCLITHKKIYTGGKLTSSVNVRKLSSNAHLSSFQENSDQKMIFF